MIFLIPILLLVILIVLLFGAAAVKASIARNLQLMAACVVLGILWTTARSLPAEFWWGVGGIVAVGLSVLAFVAVRDDKRAKADMRSIYAETGLSPEEVDHCMSLPVGDQAGYHLKILTRNNDADTAARMAEYGMTDGEIENYIALIKAEKNAEAQALHQMAMERQRAKPEPGRLNIRGY